jgi:hypothetical protein
VTLHKRQNEGIYMGRILILLGLVALAVYLVRKIYLSPPDTQSTEKQRNQQGIMKKCLHCDLHVPSEQGCEDPEGRFFCSEEHKQAHKP